MANKIFSAVLVLLVAASVASAFAPLAPTTTPFSSSATTTTTSLNIFGGGGAKASSASIKPKFNAQTQKWERAPGDDGEYPYDPVGSLLRHGPAPYLKRVFEADMYEQAVLKYMAQEGCSRSEATGNMDAAFNNAQDWAYQKMQERKGAPKVDYTVLKKKDAFLTATWGLFIVPVVYYVVSDTIQKAFHLV